MAARCSAGIKEMLCIHLCPSRCSIFLSLSSLPSTHLLPPAFSSHHHTFQLHLHAFSVSGRWGGRQGMLGVCKQGRSRSEKGAEPRCGLLYLGGKQFGVMKANFCKAQTTGATTATPAAAASNPPQSAATCCLFARLR